MGIFQIFTERKAIMDIMLENELKNVYFDDLFYMNSDGSRIDILKVENTGFEFLITFEENDKQSTILGKDSNMIMISMIYLRIQKMVREFNV